jgi:hypothetical protein
MTPKRAFIIWIPSLVLLCFIATGSAIVWAETISLDEYGFRIEESLERLEAKDGMMQPEESLWFLENFPPDLVVQDVEGELFPVDRSGFLHWIQEAEDSPNGRDSLEAYQEALLEQISWGRAGLLLEKRFWDERRNVLKDVYAGKEFRYLHKRYDPAWKEHLRRFIEALTSWLEDHLDFLGGIQSKWVLHLLYGVVLILGAILTVWISRLFGPVGWRRKHPSADPSVSFRSPSEKDWWAWRGEANKKAREGAYREAIRFLFISVLMEGHQKGWWIYGPEATNWEHLARVEDHAERRKALQRLIERYELAWYGVRQPGEKDFQDCEKWVYQMEASA